MPALEIKRKESLTRQETAQRLAALASALKAGGDVELQLGATTVRLRVPDNVHSEFEVEVDGDEVELELELKWSTAKLDSVPAKSVPAKSVSRKSASAVARK